MKLLKLIIPMLFVALLSAISLAVVYKLTKEPIKAAKNAKELSAINEVIVTEFNNNPFEEKIQIKNTGIEIYPARLDGTITSVAIKTFSNDGFGGKIELIVGFFLDGTITGYKIIEQKETPGLGDKVMEDGFANQLAGLHPDEQTFGVKQDGGEIDAVTGATISSRAVINTVKRAFDVYTNLSKGNNANADE